MEKATRIAANDNFDRKDAIHPLHSRYSSKSTLSRLLARAESEEYESRGKPVIWDNETGESLPLKPDRIVAPRPPADPAVELERHRTASQEAVRRRAVETARLSGKLDKIARRQAKGEGWDGKADNDNLDFPIIKILKAESQDRFLALVMRYRRLVDDCANELRGAGIPDDLFFAQKSEKLDARADVDEYVATGNLPSGEIKRKGNFQSSAAHHAIPAKQKASTDSESPQQVRHAAAPVPKKWDGDNALIAYLDGKPVLAQLRAAMGPLTSAFEEAALEAATLEDIGKRGGIGNPKGAMGAGRYAVFTALRTLDEAWQQIDNPPKSTRRISRFAA